MGDTYVEGNLEFTFDKRWSVVKYDEKQGWYHRVFERALDGTAGIDFLGLYGSRSLYFIEVTDTRGHAISSKNVQQRESLGHGTGRKIRDTVAGLVGALRTDRNDPFWTEANRMLADQNSAICVVLWYEPAVGGSADVRVKRVKGALDTVAKDLKKRLRWLMHDKYVSVRSIRAPESAQLPGVNVRGVSVAS